MALSQTSICNLALRRVGDKTITSLTDSSKEASLCALLYEPILEQVLTSSPWNCALFRTQLSEDSSTPAFGWAHQYNLPNDPKCLQVQRMEDARYEWVREGDLLLTDVDEAKILYIGYVNDPTKLSPHVVKVFYLNLAIELSFVLTQTNTIKGLLLEELQEAEKIARSIDSREGTPMRVDKSNWISSRYAGTGYGVNLTNAK